MELDNHGEKKRYAHSEIHHRLSFLHLHLGHCKPCGGRRMISLPSPSGGNDTAAIQAAIDAAGNNAYLSASGAHVADGLRLDGSGGNLSGIVLELPRGTSIAANPGSNNNVISAHSGSGHTVLGRGKIIGSKSNGGVPVRAPTRAFWFPSISYAVNDTVEVSASDVQTTAVVAGNLVYKCTTAHTSASAFLADKTTKWNLVSDPNFDQLDLSYALRNGVYFGNCTDFEISGITVEQCVYAAINLGSGPVQPANIGGPAIGGRVDGAILRDSENGVAGGRWQDVTFHGNRVMDMDVYGLVLDGEADGNTIDGNTFIGKSNSLNALFSYKGVKNILSKNQIRGPWLNGLIVDQASDTKILDSMIRDVLNVGIFTRNSPVTGISGNDIKGGVVGIQGVSSYDLGVANNNVRDQSDANVSIDACSLVNISGANIFRNGGTRGLRLNGSIYVNVNDAMIADAVGPGIDAIASSNLTITGVTATDTRSGGNKTQTYGVKSDANSHNIVLTGNTLTGNKTASKSMLGSGNVIDNNKE